MTTLVLNELSQAERRRLGLPDEADRLCPALARRLARQAGSAGQPAVGQNPDPEAGRESSEYRHFAGSALTDMG